ncbi:MAG: type II toxin-antitoxin system RelE/ParE family toxin [Verrucomicrobiae bacterium]|nr:type II toxin-antitoxin system RelE/ParE family toxin [Verrucomicrobiae bacterium]
MTETLILLPEAKADVANAYRWYENQSQGLGMEFLRCVETTLLSIQRTPFIHPCVYEFCRRALVRRFPFAIFFELEQDQNRCVVYSIFHCSQNPQKWQNRLPMRSNEPSQES